MSAIASSVSTPVVVSQATKRTHAEMSASENAAPQNPPVSSSNSFESSSVNKSPASQPSGPDEKNAVEVNSSDSAATTQTSQEPLEVKDKPSADSASKEAPAESSVPPVNDTSVDSKEAEPNTQSSSQASVAAKVSTTEIPITPASTAELPPSNVEMKAPSSGASAEKPSCVDTTDKAETNKAAEVAPVPPASKIVAPSQPAPVSSIADSTTESMETAPAASGAGTANTTGESPMSQSTPVPSNVNDTNSKSSSSKPQLEDGEEPEKKAKLSPAAANSSKGSGKTPEQILEYMDKTFDQRRKIITKQMPTIPELKDMYPDLFMGKQLLIEFQRITKIDIDQKIQEFCVRYATAVIEMARNKKGAAPVLARWEQAKQENDTLKQYWDMVTALCLLPLHFGENFVEMVLEIGEDEEVVAQGKIVPTLVARGNIFRTDEFFLIAENTIVQEFEEFTIAFASLYSSYWVFNMVYPETIENTYNYIQRCIVRQREPGSIPTVCKNFTKALQKWNKGKEGK